jgi:glycosyltransferase involved in cell wall biosynthesis
VSESSLRGEVLRGFDRVLAYTKFGADQTGYPDHLPHGIDTRVWQPRDHTTARSELCKSFTDLTPTSLLLGVVATNQARKDWRLAAETCRLLLERGHDVRMWAHTDGAQGWWDLPRMFDDHGLKGRVAITTFQLSDAQMTWMYSACDVTLGIGLGEGWGLPLAESLACGVPVVHGRYAGAVEFVPNEYLVTPIKHYFEGPGCAARPIYNANDWANKVTEIMGQKPTVADYIKWDNCWLEWKKWLLR